ncbi:MAG: protein kinase [Deltaproteobacteria bacterium]|nr:protein kinase [Deltaproteobacteria bacterium]
MTTSAAFEGWQPGMVIGGKYVLTRLLADGGLSSVFEAQHVSLGRRVAIKVLRPEVAFRQDVVGRLRREARAASALDHPNIVEIFDFGQDAVTESFFIVQRLLHGVDLRTHLDARQRLSVEESLEIIVPVMGALVSAHRRGVVHRDLKPENIFLARAHGGEIVPTVIDFGIAKQLDVIEGAAVTQDGMIIGTVQYMSPEQARGETVDARTDVWAIAVVLFELLTGHCPFDAPTIVGAMMKIIAHRVPSLAALVDLPPELAVSVDRALERDKTRRWPTMGEFLRGVLAADPHLRERHPGALAELEDDAPDDELPIIVSLPPPPLELPDTDEAPAAESLELLPDLAAMAFAHTDAFPLLPQSRAPGAVDAAAPEDDGVLTSTSDWAAATSRHMAIRRSEHPAPAPEEPSLARAIEQAIDAFNVNALDETVALARAASVHPDATEHVAGRMRVLEAMAKMWLGDVETARSASREALALLPPGSPGWFTALGHAAIASGYLGDREDLLALRDEHRAVSDEQRHTHGFATAGCRLAIHLLRVGDAEACAEAFGAVQLVADVSEASDVIDAWLSLTRAELAAHRGDLATSLRLVERAVEAFSEAGDARNACRQRAAVGYHYLLLGEYETAETVLEEALQAAEAMRLYFAPTVRWQLAWTLARTDRLDEALPAFERAIADCVAQRNRRAEAQARTFYARALGMAGDLRAAEREARRATDFAEAPQPIRALALTVVAWATSSRGEAIALDAARRAVEAFGVASAWVEGEHFARLTYAETLRLIGRSEESRRVLREARDRLLSAASKIDEPALRSAFLERVAEHAELLERG